MYIYIYRVISPDRQQGEGERERTKHIFIYTSIILVALSTAENWQCKSSNTSPTLMITLIALISLIYRGKLAMQVVQYILYAGLGGAQQLYIDIYLSEKVGSDPYAYIYACAHIHRMITDEYKCEDDQELSALLGLSEL